MNKQRTVVVLADEDELSIQGQRLSSQPPSFWLYYSSNKSTNENQQPTAVIQKNKNLTTNFPRSSVRDDGKQISTENTPARWYHQVSRNVNELTKSTSKRNPFTTSFSLPMQTSPEPSRPTTALLILDEDVRRTVSARVKSNTPFRPLNPPVIDFSDSLDELTNSSIFQFKSTICDSDNQFMQRSYTDSSSREQFLDSSVVITPPVEVREKIPDEAKTLRRNSQSQINGFQHIANLGSWQRRSKNKVEKSLDIEHEDDLDHSSERIYEYKSPFSEEYDQTISFQANIPTNNNNSSNEWSLKDFYHDVKTPFEPGTNTKPVFEKCLKLSRLQANTIKWEQRRRQNLNIYNRLTKNSSFDNGIVNFNGNISANLADLKRELRCNECKRVTCLGNCAPGQEYHQYKRLIPASPSPTTREQIRSKLGLRTQRSMLDNRPRSQQMIRTEPTNFNPVVVVPLFEDESPNKRPQKKFTHGFLPGRSFRSQRRETLTFFSSHKVSL